MSTRSWLAAVLALAALGPVWAAGPQKVTLQLKWAHQFQFAGYYAAQVKGFYRAEGLDVTLLEASPTRLPLPMVESRQAEFGVSDLEVFQAYLQGRPLVALGVVFQHSPNVLLALRASGIHRPSQLAGRALMCQGDQGLVETRALLASEGIHLDRLRQVPHSWNLDDLIQGKVDLITAYSTNEPFLLKQRGVDWVQLRASDYGIDFYGDLLFTTQGFAKDHPTATEAFRRASFKGWDYAMDHAEEIIEVILTLPGVKDRGVTREKLRFEAERMRELVLPGLVEIGHMNPGRFRRMADLSVSQGFGKPVRDPEGFLYHPIVPTARAWLKGLLVTVPVLTGLGLLGALWILQLRRTVEARTRELREEVLQRQQGEAAYEQSASRLRTLIDTLPDMVWMKDAEGVYLQCNRRFEQFFGASEKDIVGKTDYDFLDRAMADFFRENDRLAISAGLPRMNEEEITFADDGHREFLETIKTPLFDRDGRALGVLGIGRNITERRRAAEENLKLQALLQQAQKMESLGSLAGGVAHDMNNVLGAILGLASARLEAHPPESSTRRALGTIIKAAERGGTMVKRLLNFARQSPVENFELDLNAVLQEVARLLERTTLSKVRLVQSLAPDLRPIRGDASALTHAFMNLCVNAVDAMAENGILTLQTCNADQDWVEVTVEDTGTGMPREILEKALDPFFTTKEVGKGTGLGLSIVYSTVKAHQGSLELNSVPGRGTCVRMRFPACAEALPDQEPPDGRPPLPLQGRLKVLLVDDDELMQTSMQAILEALGHAATLSPSGENALALLEAGLDPDVVILDMNMPGLSGAQTLLRVRALLPKVPVLLATGRVDQAALDVAGAHAYVTLLAKPFGMKELRAHLEPLQG